MKAPHSGRTKNPVARVGVSYEKYEGESGHSVWVKRGLSARFVTGI